MNKDIKYIKDRWINKEYPIIALKCKGDWVYYKKIEK